MTDEAGEYLEKILAVNDHESLIVNDMSRLMKKQNPELVEILTVVNKFDTLHEEAMQIDPPAGFMDAHYYFLQNTLWFSLAGNAFKMAYEWNQPHWFETAIDRLYKSDDFKKISDDAIGAICFG